MGVCIDDFSVRISLVDCEKSSIVFILLCAFFSYVQMENLSTYSRLYAEVMIVFLAFSPYSSCVT